MACRVTSLPERIRPHSLHELITINTRENLRLAHDGRIREEDVQPAVFGHCIVDDLRHGLFVRGVELPHLHIYARVEGLDLALVCCEMRVAVVADVDCFGAVFGVLVGAGAAEAGGGIGSWIMY